MRVAALSQENTRTIRRRLRARAGFTLVDVMAAAVVLAVAMSGLAGSLLSAMALSRVNRETALATAAAQRLVEEAQGVPFAETFAVYNGDATDDLGLTVAARGANFAVPGLEPQDGDADGQCGRVMFPVGAILGVGEELREDALDARLGMPRDLDLDGVIDAADHAGDYALLPLRVRIEWRGVSGARRLDFETVLCER